ALAVLVVGGLRRRGPLDVPAARRVAEEALLVVHQQAGVVAAAQLVVGEALELARVLRVPLADHHQAEPAARLGDQRVALVVEQQADAGLVLWWLPRPGAPRAGEQVAGDHDEQRQADEGRRQQVTPRRPAAGVDPAEQRQARRVRLQQLRDGQRAG